MNDHFWPSLYPGIIVALLIGVATGGIFAILAGTVGGLIGSVGAYFLTAWLGLQDSRLLARYPAGRSQRRRLPRRASRRTGGKVALSRAGGIARRAELQNLMTAPVSTRSRSSIGALAMAPLAVTPLSCRSK